MAGAAQAAQGARNHPEPLRILPAIRPGGGAPAMLALCDDPNITRECRQEPVRPLREEPAPPAPVPPPVAPLVSPPGPGETEVTDLDPSRMAAAVEVGSTGLKRPAASNRRPAKKKHAAKPKSQPAKKPAASKPASSGGAPKAKAKAKAGQTSKAVCKRPVGNDRAQVLAKIPKHVLNKFKSGCSRCRFRAFCTLSCWKLRGY